MREMIHMCWGQNGNKTEISKVQSQEDRDPGNTSAIASLSKTLQERKLLAYSVKCWPYKLEDLD